MASSGVRPVLILIAAATSLCSLLIVQWDHSFHHRWLAFYLWIVPIGLVHTRACLRCLRPSRDDPAFRGYELAFLALLFVPRFLWLESYPFIAMHDEVRDGGHRPLGVLTGEALNIFATDWSQTMFFATVVSHFYQLFGSSTLTYRLPGALLAVAELLILYFGVRKLSGPLAAALSATVLATLPISLYFSRTESLITATSLITTSGLIAVLLWYHRADRASRDNDPSSLVMFGSTAGFALLVHGAARPVMCVLALALLAGQVIQLVRSQKGARPPLCPWCLSALAFGAAIGPYAGSLSPAFLLGSGHFMSVSLNTGMIARYWESVMVLYNRPLEAHFADNLLLNGPLPIFLAAAIVAALYSRPRPTLIAIVMLFLIPLTNSALTDALHAGHRLVPLAPVIALLIGTGLHLLFSLSIADRGTIRRVTLHSVTSAVLMTAFFVDRSLATYQFFYHNQASPRYRSPIAGAVHSGLRTVVERMNASPDPSLPRKLCIEAKDGSATLRELQPPHVVEFFAYFLPSTIVEIRGSRDIPYDRIIRVVRDCDYTGLTGFNFQLYCYGHPSRDCSGSDGYAVGFDSRFYGL